MATSGEKRWPPMGNFVATTGEKPMAIDNWNRYPGACLGSESYSYGYAFSAGLLEQWEWSELRCAA